MSNITYGPTIPEGYSPPFAIVSPEDHEAWILIATALGLVCILFFAGIRVLVRYTISRGFGWDDHTLLAATGLAIIQAALIFGACQKGFGKSLNLVAEDNYDGVQSLWYAAELLFILALGLAKISVVFFLLRISRVKEHRLAFYIAIGLMAAWTLASFFAIALQCNLAHPWMNVGENCTGMVSLEVKDAKLKLMKVAQKISRYLYRRHNIRIRNHWPRIVFDLYIENNLV